MIKMLERILGQKILSTEAVTGGDIADAQKVATASQTYFVKMSKAAGPQFNEEAAGLRALAALGTEIRIPTVHHADEHFLILEWIETKEPAADFWPAFGKALARMHKVPQNEFGFEMNNHIGTTPQTNPRRAHKEISWDEYFLEYRLKPMLNHRSLSVESLLQAEARKSMPRIREIIGVVIEPPSLLHGDLWGGNFLCDVENRPVLIDPAPYRGHREVDLALSELFGGFGPGFYSAYKTEWPLSPGYEARRTVYNLYQLLNHWIMFGTAYREQTIAAFRSL